MWAGPDREIEPVGGDRRLGTARPVAEDEMRQPTVAAPADDLRSEPDLDVRRRRKLADEVVRHSRGATHDKRHTARVAREVERLLPGRVRPAEHIDVLARHPVHVGARAAVEDARAGQSLERGDPEAAIRDTCRQDDGARRTVAPSDKSRRAGLRRRAVR